MELIWEGKFDKDGRKQAVLRVPLPFQTVETVNESADDRARNLDLFGGGRETEWRNRLIWGDKKYVLPSLLVEFAGKVDLIYIDPPFATGGDFSFTATIPDDPKTEGDQETTFVKQPSVIEQKAYRDTWGRGLDSYLKWFYDTAVLLRELLSETGSLYVHLDYHVGHYAKAVLDEVFGVDNFQNEIIWKRSTNTGSSKVLARGFSNDHDTILLYSKSATFTSNKQFVPHSGEYIKAKFTQRDERGLYQLQPLKTVSAERLAELQAQGLVVEQSGKYLRYKQYLESSKGKPVSDLWMDVFAVNSQAEERMNYPTQKPEALLERIIGASSNKGDLVLDSFCGSGTTATVAEKMGRRWITCDLGRFAVHTARKRLLGIPGVKPFVVQNLGKYERQAWQVAEFGEGAEQKLRAYREFILELYHAQPLSGHVWLHGLKQGRMVHVGGVEAPVSVGDVAQIAGEFRRAIGTGANAPTQNRVDVLGWDFAFELNEVAKQQAAQAGIDVRFIRIPREVLERKAVDQGDIRFFELAALEVNVRTTGLNVALELKDFVIPLDDVPEEVQRAVTHWEQWIDYWAVDWDHRGDTFHNQWQSYRTRKDRTLQRRISQRYEQPGTYQLVVKVIDILGNDTTKTIPVEVR
jgi:adenine-specific DNA-methyltransferase